MSRDNKPPKAEAAPTPPGMETRPAISTIGGRLMTAAIPFSQAARLLRPLRADGLFRLDAAEYTAFYAPGRLCVTRPSDAARFEATLAPPDRQLEELDLDVDWGGGLWRRARHAAAQARRRQEEPFRPECLTLYLNNECNLRCAYCYADPSPPAAASLRLDLDAIAAAAEVVAASCRRTGLPFYAVFHGGGEPTLHHQQLAGALARVRAVAAAHDVPLFCYVATNGVLSEESAAWLGRHFDLVGLSCDGPADIHDEQRPRWDGRGALRVVERTAHIVREEGCALHVRTTITAASLSRQAEIADYVCQRLRPEEIHVEPVYRGGRADRGLDIERVDEFVAHFWAARAVAQERGVPWLSSGSRPAALHGPYCNVFRHVVNLVPGGRAVACFKLAEARQAEARGAVIGALDRPSGRFELDYRRVQTLRRRLGAMPARCGDCFNRYHCAGDCPDRCPLDDADRWRNGEAGFRCRLNQALTATLLVETAERLWSQILAGEPSPHGTAIL